MLLLHFAIRLDFFTVIFWQSSSKNETLTFWRKGKYDHQKHGKNSNIMEATDSAI